MNRLHLLFAFLAIVAATLFAPPARSADQFPTYEATYDKLLSDTLSALPNTRIVLDEPFVLPVGNQAADYDAHRKDLAAYQLVVKRLGKKYHLPIVHYQEAFDAACRKAPAAHWIWDGIHPTYAGHRLMAKEWLATVNKFWAKG